MNHHVARVVVWGKHADTILSSQPWNYAFGIDSPLDRFLTFDGKIILLGSDHDAITLLHYIEHIADFPNKRIAHYEVPVIEHGRRVWRAMEEVDTSSEGAQANWPIASSPKSSTASSSAPTTTAPASDQQRPTSSTPGPYWTSPFPSCKLSPPIRWPPRICTNAPRSPTPKKIDRHFIHAPHPCD